MFECVVSCLKKSSPTPKLSTSIPFILISRGLFSDRQEEKLESLKDGFNEQTKVLKGQITELKEALNPNPSPHLKGQIGEMEEACSRKDEELVEASQALALAQGSL